MTHLWTGGQEISVQADAEAQPVSFVWFGRQHGIVRVCNAWRVHTGWWRQEVRRDYFKVQTEDGLLCVVYHDLLAGRWHLVRVYD